MRRVFELEVYLQHYGRDGYLSYTTAYLMREGVTLAETAELRSYTDTVRNLLEASTRAIHQAARA